MLPRRNSELDLDAVRLIVRFGPPAVIQKPRLFAQLNFYFIFTPRESNLSHVCRLAGREISLPFVLQTERKKLVASSSPTTAEAGQ